MNIKYLLILILMITALLATSVIYKYPINIGKNTNNSEQPQVPVNLSLEIGPNVDKKQAHAAVLKLILFYPEVTPTKVEESEIEGFYLVTVDTNVFYLSKDGTIFLAGELYSLENKAKNITEEKRMILRKNLLESIPESQMIVYTPASGKIAHTITIFTDVDCIFCKRLHNQMKAYLENNIQVRYLPFPRAGTGSDSYKKVQTIWCSKDRNKTMDKALLSKKFPAKEPECDDKLVDQSLELVNKMNITGTPTMITNTGKVIPGYVPAKRLKRTLDFYKQ